jgi:1-deoxy-D-xylulose-5-phosphate synthase
MQRTYDQVSHDVGINNSPVTILLSYSGMNDLRDISHLGIFAVSTFNDIPNIVILCPSSKDELLQALEWSTTQKEHPVIIVMPSGKVVYRESKYDFNSINKFELVKKGEKVALIGLGDFFTKAQFLAVEMKDKLGFEPTLINPSFASGVDKDLLDKLALNHKVIVTLENGVKDNGLGEKIASYLGDKDIKVLNYGLEKKFIDRYEVEDLLEEIGLTSDKIIKRVSNLIK